MRPSAIVYTSNTGHTARYAALLAEATGLPAFSIDDPAAPPKGTPVIYMGWLMAGSVKDHGKAAKRYDIRCVCGVGLCTTGALLNEVRRAIRLRADIPLFTLQGGMDTDKLEGIYKKMIATLTKFMEKKPRKSEADLEMLRLLKTGGDYVSAEALSDVLAWYRGL